MRNSKAHTVVITQPDPESDDFEFEVTCPVGGNDCSLWMECRDCAHEATGEENDDGEYTAHGKHHQDIDGEWMTSTGHCASTNSDGGVDGLNDLAHQFGPSTQQFEVDYWGDGIFDIIHVPAEATPVTGPDVTRPLKTGYEATFEITPVGQNLLFGGPIKPPTHRLIIEHAIPRLPEAPRKGHPLVGKRYRMARRKHGQAIRRWARDGYAMDTIRTYMPAVNITFENETR